MNKEQRKEYQRKWAAEKRALAKGVDKLDKPVDKPDVDVVIVDKVAKAVGLTRTDALYEAENPGYYEYQAERERRECIVCGKPYETRLEMNRFCAPECKREMIGRLSTMEVAA